jgi:hypothetical protein
MKPIPFLLVALFASTALAAKPAETPALQELPNLETKEAVFKASSATKPIVLKTEKEAADYFTADELTKLGKRHVDFKDQIILIFAWQGSGQDKLSYSIAESFPEQITFTYAPGRTKDLRSHIQIFALRANVTWSAK